MYKYAKVQKVNINDISRITGVSIDDVKMVIQKFKKDGYLKKLKDGYYLFDPEGRL